MSFKDLPDEVRPREKLMAQGAAALGDAELLALLLRTGTRGKNVLQLAQELLDTFGGLDGLLNTAPADLKRIKGLGGTAKRAELSAVLELTRRSLGQGMKVRECLASAKGVKDYLQLHLATKPHEVFATLFLDAKNRLIAMEELFRGTLTQTSVRASTLPWSETYTLSKMDPDLTEQRLCNEI
jgi:DNA repair protein RadC